MKDLTCPYCSHEFDVCHDDGFGYSESVRHEQQCPVCDKIFVFTTHVSLSYTEYKADCLNGVEHKLRRSITVPRRYSRMNCTCCDYSRPCTQEEITLIEEEVKNYGYSY